ncbi:acyltransferase family protein [Niveibacterium sp. 24ML]|uniref:acyltransferase family protein n=1 Tax=Niveibacterium sp. 24ML TaxID=2985512 RepID=UPI00226E4BF0|nr:acyltransferase family protein [Niveibacterium sp. 24ML]MCX9157556.1 acyltransferase family protein [Niveibacterium sp. 24ML]
MSRTASRFVLIDALKALASQLIVLHHLAYYGPMSDLASALAPALFAWLAHDARLVVQVFLVIGGFLAARGLAPDARFSAREGLVTLVWQRYLRLAVPLMAMLVFAIVAAAIARALFEHDATPARPSIVQVLAHLFLLQDLVGQEALSAGVWYVAIDLQLFALFAMIMWLARAPGPRVSAVLGPVAVAGLALLSIFYFNRDAAWDVAAPYFFGAYALGAFAWWGAQRGRAWWLMALMTATLLALEVDFRERLALAACVALALMLAQSKPHWCRALDWRLLAWLSRISYPLFLIHFPVCLLVNAAFAVWLPQTAPVQALGVLIAWLGSVAVADLFGRWVDTRAPFAARPVAAPQRA